MKTLLATPQFRTWCHTLECELLWDLEGEGIGVEDNGGVPSFMVKFRNFGDEGACGRLLGHLEFLAGTPGALSEAYRLRKTTKWGSLRFVLGEVPCLFPNVQYANLNR